MIVDCVHTRLLGAVLVYTFAAAASYSSSLTHMWKHVSHPPKLHLRIFNWLMQLNIVKGPI